MDNVTTFPVAVTLSREELVYLMQLLKIPVLPGITVNMPEEILPAVMAGAERALRARHFLHIEANRIIVESTLMGILGFCARPEAGIVLYRGEQNGFDTSVIYHLSDTLRIKHQATEGLHTFELLNDHQAVMDDALAFLDLLNSPAQTVEPIEFEITGNDLLAASISRLDMAQPDETIVDMLGNLGLNEDDALQLVQIVRYDTVASAFVGIWPQNETLPGIGVIETNDAWWLLLTLENTANRVRYLVKKVNSDAAHDQVFALLNGVLAI